MPTGGLENYYVIRARESVAMASAASDPAARNIHLDLAKRYADIARTQEAGAIDKQKTIAGTVRMHD